MTNQVYNLFIIVCYCLLGTGGALWVCRCTMLTVEDIGSVTLPEEGLASGRPSSCCTISLHTKTHGCLWLRCAMRTCFFYFFYFLLQTKNQGDNIILSLTVCSTFQNICIFCVWTCQDMRGQHVPVQKTTLSRGRLEEYAR